MNTLRACTCIAESQSLVKEMGHIITGLWTNEWWRHVVVVADIDSARLGIPIHGAKS